MACGPTAKKNTPPTRLPDALDEYNLFGKVWVHLREEDNEMNALVFRPSDFGEIPPARFREKFEFDKDGSCQYLSLASNDAHKMQEGSWEMEEDRLVVKDSKGNVVYSYVVVKCERDLLLMRES